MIHASLSFGHILLIALFLKVCVGLPHPYNPPQQDDHAVSNSQDWKTIRGQDSSHISTSGSSCPMLPVVTSFQPLRYLGRWYEIERFDAPFQMGDCVTADYGIFPNCSISVVNSNVVRGKLESAFAYASTGPDPTEGRLIVNFPQSPNSIIVIEPNYNIVATDYDNYAVVYGCDDLGEGQTFEFSWILGRRTDLNQGFLDNLKKWLDQTGINTEKYKKTNQQHCLRRPI